MRLFGQYFAKIATNLITLVAAATALTVVPRALGPAEYGLYEYLTNLFLQFKAFFDFGTSSSFYTLLSQRSDEAGLIKFYKKFLFINSLILLGCALILLYTPFGKFFSMANGSSLVIFASLYAIAILWLDNIRKIIDAKNLTVGGELYYGAVKSFSIIILLALYYFSILTILSYLLFQIVVVMLIIFFLMYFLRLKNAGKNKFEPSKTDRAYFREFWTLSHPLVVYTLMAALTGLADRWILQKYAGSIEQGFFGLANQISVVCFLLSASMVQIFSRELSQAWHIHDIPKMADLFRKIVPSLYTATACLSIFVAFYSADLIKLIGGMGWKDGAVALAIMAIYPMHQTYGQLSGSIFFSTGQTGLYRDISIIGMLVGLPVVVWFLSPISDGGLGMGAVGLALKVVLIQALFVNIGLWFNCRLLSIDFVKLILHQIYVPFVLFFLLWTLDGAINYFGFSTILKIVLVGCAYFSLICLIIFLTPRFAGLSNSDLIRFKLFFKDKVGL